jgi:hypothetical protein
MLHIYKHILQNISVNIFQVKHLLDFDIQTAKSVFISQYIFLANVNKEKIYVNIPKCQNIFNKTMCMQIVHITAHKANVW